MFTETKNKFIRSNMHIKFDIAKQNHTLTLYETDAGNLEVVFLY